MNRRKFGLLATTSAALGAIGGTARAQSAAPAAADLNLLKTTLTPYGAERAGNADGSIPAWTGGWTGPATAPTQTIDVPIPFGNEAMLYKVDSGNLGQHQGMVADGIAAMITKYGFYLQVFPTHRTAAAPQYVYDNIAKNAVNAKFDPAGGRFGFSGAYGGIPFPIIDTSNPQVAGAQLIWNHLCHWEGFENNTDFSPCIVVTNGQLVLTGAPFSRFHYPYYDPNGTLETYNGYYSMLHTVEKAPADVEGQEELVWHSTNINVKPDIVWTLLNGQGRVRKAPNEQYDTPNPSWNGISNIDESQCFYGNPHKFDWTLIGKKEMLIPYNNNDLHDKTAQEICGPTIPNPAVLRWEKHRVWVVEATLHPGERNVLPKRRIYIDEDTGQGILGESYDADNTLTRVYMVPVRSTPSIPMTNPSYVSAFSVITGDYVVNGNFAYPPHAANEYTAPQPMSQFDATQMAAGASF